MPKRTKIDQARPLLEKPIAFEDFRAKLSARDGGDVDRHLAALDQEPEHAHRDAWKRLVRSLATLAPHSISTTGQQAISFFIADGKYRMQVFALEDKRDGKLSVYAVDALADAIAAKLVKAPTKDVPDSTLHELENRQTLSIESLTAQNTPNPPPFFKHMLGWNRTAVRITFPTHASEHQLIAVETMCALAALRWVDAQTNKPKPNPKDRPPNASVLVSR